MPPKKKGEIRKAARAAERDDIRSAASAHDNAIDAAVALITKKYGKGAVARLNDKAAYADVAHVVPTGIASLDNIVFGCGGVPLEKIIEIFGPESVGKSTFVKWLMTRAQHATTPCICGQVHAVVPGFWDAEQSGESKWDAGHGLDLSSAIGGQPDTLEQTLDEMSITMKTFKAKKTLGLLGLDSVAACPLSAELELGFDEEDRMARRAAYLSKNIPKLVNNQLKDSGVGLIFVNQVRAKIGAMAYQKQTDTPGGRALKHAYHIRLELSHMGRIKAGDIPIGIGFRVQAIKNKVAPPFGTAELEIYFNPPRLVEKGTPVERPKRTPVRFDAAGQPRVV